MSIVFLGSQLTKFPSFKKFHEKKEKQNNVYDNIDFFFFCYNLKRNNRRDLKHTSNTYIGKITGCDKNYFDSFKTIYRYLKFLI